MAKPSPFELELIEKITRAKVKVEAIEKRKHPNTCPASDDGTGGVPGRCNCGAREYNSHIDSILSDLKIE